MLVIPNRVQSCHTNQGQRGRGASARKRLVAGEKQGRDQTSHQEDIQHWLDDEDDVPGIPVPREWPERVDPIVVGEIKQNVAEAGNVSKQKQQSPARWKIRNVGLASAQPPDQVYETGDERRDQNQSEKRVGEAAVMGKSKDRAI